MKRATILPLVLLVTVTGPVGAEQQSASLRISATIPPHPCEFPDQCNPPPASAKSSVTITGDKVLYVGTPPAVARKDDLLTVRF